MKEAHAGGGRSTVGAYYGSYLRWLQCGLPVAEAYAERSAIHARALCYVQARLAVTLLECGGRAAQRYEERSPMHACACCFLHAWLAGC